MTTQTRTTDATKKEKHTLSENYIAFLQKLTTDKCAMAMLKRGIGKKYGTLDMCRYVYPFLPENRLFLSEESFFQIASLFALHPETCAMKSFGDSFRQLWQARKRIKSIENRFNALLAADREMLPTHLHRAVMMMKDKGIRVDYAGLLIDINSWEHEDQYIQRKWAKDFWGNK